MTESYLQLGGTAWVSTYYWFAAIWAGVISLAAWRYRKPYGFFWLIVPSLTIVLCACGLSGEIASTPLVLAPAGLLSIIAASEKNHKTKLRTYSVFLPILIALFAFMAYLIGFTARYRLTFDRNELVQTFPFDRKSKNTVLCKPLRAFVNPDDDRAYTITDGHSSLNVYKDEIFYGPGGKIVKAQTVITSFVALTASKPEDKGRLWASL